MGTAAAKRYAGMSDEELAATNPTTENQGLGHKYAQRAYDAEVAVRKTKAMKANEDAAAQRTKQMYATAPAPAQPLATSSGDTSGPARKEADTEDGATSTRRRAQFRGAGGTAISI